MFFRIDCAVWQTRLLDIHYLSRISVWLELAARWYANLSHTWGKVIRLFACSNPRLSLTNDKIRFIRTSYHEGNDELQKCCMSMNLISNTVSSWITTFMSSALGSFAIKWLLATKILYHFTPGIPDFQCFYPNVKLIVLKMLCVSWANNPEEKYVEETSENAPNR